MDTTIDGILIVDYPSPPINNDLEIEKLNKSEKILSKERIEMELKELEKELIDASCIILTNKLDAIFSGFPLGEKMTDEIVEYYKEQIKEWAKDKFDYRQICKR